MTLVAPKVESTASLEEIDRLLDRLETGRRIGVQALIETGRGLAAVQSIAGASDRLQALILGYADLAASLGRPLDTPGSWRTAQDMVVLAARANGIQPIDGPFFVLHAGDALSDAAKHARRCGFDGKWAIHPSQIETLNAVFTPSEEEVAQARSLIAALDGAQQEGAGAVAFDGSMIDEAMRATAMRTLARAGEPM